MRLSEENARRLNALVWRDRLKRIVPLVALGAVIVAVLTWLLLWQVSKSDATVDVTSHQATVLGIKHAGTRGAAILHVHLDDGREVDAVSGMRVDPQPGAHVVVNEARHSSGRVTYDVARLAN
jgi:hypothetical protein